MNRGKGDLLRRAFSAVMCILLLTGILNLAFKVQCVKSSSATITVPDDYPTIQEAIDHAVEKDTVLVRSGTYYGNLVVQKAISLIGEDRETTIIDANRIGTVILISGCMGIVVIDGFTVRNSGLEYYAGIYVSNVSCQIVNNNITGNLVGILLYDSSNCTISGNNLEANEGNGVSLSSSSYNTITHNNFANNSNQVYVYQSNNSLDVGYPSGGNYWSDYGGIDANNDGIGDSPYVVDVDNQDNYPLVHQWSSLPVHNINTGLGYAAIQEAVNANETLDGHTIFVEAGIYSQRLSVNKTINLIGEGRVVTIIDGFLVDVTADNVMVSGFAVRGEVRLEADGCTVDNNTIFNASPYGVWLLNSTNNVVSNNVMIANDYNIRLDESSNNTISQNYIGSIEWEGGIRLVYGGIELYHSPNNTVTQNNVTQCSRAISMEGPSFQVWASNNTISQNNIEYDGFSGGWGIKLDRCSNNTIIENNITRLRARIAWEGVGMSLSSSHFNTIAQNRIKMSGEGLTLSESHFNFITQNNATDNIYGLKVSSSAWNLIGQNYVANNYFGILIGQNYPDYNNTLRHNEMTGNTYNFGVEGSALDALDVDVTNTVDGKPIYYWVSRRDDQIPLDAGYVAIVNSTNIRVEDLDIRNNYQGILIANSNDTTILHNNVTSNRYGIRFEFSLNNTISENDVTGNSWDGISFISSRDNYVYRNRVMNHLGTGISIDGSSNNSLFGNSITANEGIGIVLGSSSSYNSIYGNSITANNGDGIYLYSSVNNSISENNMTANNYGGGLCLESSSNNKIFHNNFVNDNIQVYSSSSANIWDNGYPSGGNFWSDYSGIDLHSGLYQNETGIDGVGDAPYVIDGDNTDRYPLMRPYAALIGDVNGDEKVDMKDVMAAVQAFNSFPGQSRWNPNADIDNSGRIDMRDLVIVVLNFNKHE